jgi:glucose-6-phosphate isomerase
MTDIAFEKFKIQLKNNELYLFDYNTNFDYIKKLAATIKKKYDSLVIIGFGASSLNIQALLSCLDIYNLNIFYLDNTDQNLINSAQKLISLDKTAVFAISQSGETDEVICLLNFLVVAPQNLYISAKKGSSLFKLSYNLKANYIEYPSNFNVGRCSMFSPIFLIIAEIMGIDSENLFNQATKAINSFEIQQQVREEASWMLQQYSSGKPNIVIISYIPKLQGLIKWINQIIAESLGKDGFGFMPNAFWGTNYEHSVLQLLLDGPNDKCYMIFLNNSNQNSIDKLLQNHGKKVLNQLINLEKPVKISSLIDINEKTIANLIIKHILTIGTIGQIQRFNPFNQPAVEKLKLSLAE